MAYKITTTPVKIYEVDDSQLDIMLATIAGDGETVLKIEKMEVEYLRDVQSIKEPIEKDIIK